MVLKPSSVAKKAHNFFIRCKIIDRLMIMLQHEVKHLLLFGNSSLSISGKCLVMKHDHSGVF